MMRRAQSWSVDVVLAIVIFGFIAIAFTSFALLSKPDIEELQNAAQRVTVALSSDIIVGGNSCGPVLLNDTINNVTLACLYENIDYEEFKQAAKLKTDFCLYIEDEAGQLVTFGPGISSWGSSRIQVAGCDCGATLPC